MEIDKNVIIWLRFFQAYKIFWLETYFSKSLSKKFRWPTKKHACWFLRPNDDSYCRKIWLDFQTFLINLFKLIKSSLKIKSNFSAVWVIIGPQKSICVVFDGSSNFSQKDFEKYVSSQKILYSWKKTRPNNDVFINFHLKNYSFSY